MYTIESDLLKVAIQAKGAELSSIYHKVHQLEYMWSADPAYWPKKSPVLFPMVGTLKENTYHYKGAFYQLGRHGFAREKQFAVTDQQSNSIVFSLESDQETRAVFPFAFRFDITYVVEEDRLSVTYAVTNPADEPLYFSVGGHPAFNVPLVEGTAYNDYVLRFNKKETVGRWPITKDGLIDRTPNPLLNNSDELPLTKDLFKSDAIVLKNLQSNEVQLVSPKTPHGLAFDFTGFPFLGLWAAPGADFVCIEPWCGIADSVDSNQQWQDKEGIIKLMPENTFSATWNARFF